MVRATGRSARAVNSVVKRPAYRSAIATRADGPSGQNQPIAKPTRGNYASTRITNVSPSTPSYAIASAIASFCIAAMRVHVCNVHKHCHSGPVLWVNEGPDVSDTEGPEDLFALRRPGGVVGPEPTTYGL